MIDEKMEDILQLALSLGLDPYPVVQETVERSTMFNVCAYGLPTRARHWSYGRSYDHQKTHGEMGLSKVYEIILNNNPSYALLLDTNTPVQNLFITAHCIGHCFVPGTLIETVDGPKKIEEIGENDKLLTHTGLYRKPMTISNREYSGEIIRFKVGSQYVECTPEHPFLVVKHSRCNLSYRSSICRPVCQYHQQKRCNNKPYKNYQAEWIKAQDIKKDDFVVYPKSKLVGVEPLESFRIEGKKGDGHPGGVKNISYDIKIDENFGEFLGLFLAEGYSRPGGQMGLCFHTKEELFHTTSINLVNKLFGLKCYNSIDLETHSHQILFNEKVLAGWLSANVGSGCQNKCVPDFIMRGANDSFIVGLLRGLFHGDGYNGNRNCSLTTTSAMLATQVRQFCMKVGVKANVKIRKRPDRKTAYVVMVTGTSRDKFAYKTSISWDMRAGNRSWEKCWFDDDNVYVPVSEVTRHHKSTIVYNLEIPKDSSYVLFAGAVTHNSDFFKNNCLFQGSNRNMIRHAAQHAGRIEEYIERFGFEKVEHLMDIGFALDDQMDWNKKLHRKPYGKKEIITRYRKRGEFDDVLYKMQKKTVVKETVNDKFPPSPEKDFLWFFINYAPLEEWERDILDIIREESFYFYPQKMTKIMNEGWASYWHAELMYQYDGLTSEEYLDFVRDHERVVQPGGNPFRINPYFLGFRIFRDIEKRWDEQYGKGAGRKKMFEVRKEDDDISFLRNYLTADLVEELELFTYGYQKDYPKDHDKFKLIEIKERMRDEVVETLVKPLYNGGSPRLSIIGTGQEGALILRHDSEEVNTLDFRFAQKTLEYIWDLWAAPVELHTKNDDGEDVLLCFDEAGFYERSLKEELDFGGEEDLKPEKKSKSRIII